MREQTAFLSLNALARDPGAKRRGQEPPAMRVGLKLNFILHQKQKR